MSNPPADQREPLRPLLRLLAAAVSVHAGFSILENGLLQVPWFLPLLLAVALPTALQSRLLTGPIEAVERGLRALGKRLDAGWKTAAILSFCFPGLCIRLMNLSAKLAPENRHLRAGLNLLAIPLGLLLFAGTVLIGLPGVLLVVGPVEAFFRPGPPRAGSDTLEAGPVGMGTGTGAARSASTSGSSGGVNPVVEGLKGKRIVNNGLLIDCPTGLMVDNDGRLVEEGLFNKPTGYRIADDGRVVEEGLFSRDTGIRITADGRIVRDGLFGSTTEARITPDGRVVTDGLFGATDTGTSFR
jgi:hypothetical protein